VPEHARLTGYISAQRRQTLTCGWCGWVERQTMKNTHNEYINYAVFQKVICVMGRGKKHSDRD
jgi:hypothetical protein